MREPMTIRKLFELFQNDPQFLDAPLMISVRDGNQNGELVAAPADLWGMPRAAAIESTGEPARIYLQVLLERKRLVNRRAA